MAKSVFFSYAREDRHVVAPVAKYLENGGFAVFFDQDIIGGQQWWDRLLTKIEECDAFVPVLSSLYLRSGPCRIEVSYAVELGKALIPLDLSGGTLASAAFIEPIKAAQWIAYDASDQMGTLLKLIAAVNNSPDAPPLPEGRQRPPAPGADVLASAVRLVGSPTDLTETEQWAVVGELRANMRGETGPAARALLESFLLRRDLLASVYQDASAMVTESRTPPPRAVAPVAKQAPASNPPDVEKPQRPPKAGPTVVPQPAVNVASGTSATGERPPSYLLLAVITALAGLLVFGVGAAFGVVALVDARKVNALWEAGDEVGAREASKRASVWIAIGLVVVFGVLAVVGAAQGFE